MQPISRLIVPDRNPVSRRALMLGAMGAVMSFPAAWGGETQVKIRDLWAEHGEFSELAKQLAGKRIAVRGYMAPPLKAEIDFFVLTRIPMAFCPFCDSNASWPDDLMLVRVANALAVVPFNTLIVTEGVLDIGTETDEATGFVSRVRLVDAQYRAA